ncbi:hypothetical protein RRG08_062560 [Elysia crispata]|uniref:Uncharacterized protein n=1 Tax=Elysia crispata TaxID=231223 RepID=A0AAE1ANF4_9GAST|nr:hypothetical protein RRG08_062560 [Elysia crispata]
MERVLRDRIVWRVVSPRSHRVSHGASVERPYCLEGRVSPLTPRLPWTSVERPYCLQGRVSLAHTASPMERVLRDRIVWRVVSPRSHRVSHGVSVERPYCLEGRVSPLTPRLPWSEC